MRGQNHFTMMIAEAMKKLEEIKGIQFFGGDALNLKEYETTFTVGANDYAMHCWRIVMTPTRPNYTMPVDVRTLAGNATSFSNAQIERVWRTDGAFEFLVMTDANYGSNPIVSALRITYSGAATFTITQIA